MSASNIQAQGGFWTGTFVPPKAGTYLLQVTWAGVWEAELSTSICVLGASDAQGHGIFHMNVFDVTHPGYVFSNDLTYSVYDHHINCGLSWVGNNPTEWDVFGSTTAGLSPGDTYQFYTYLDVYEETGAAGLAGATAVGNFGSDLNSAILVSAYWTIT
ncbi:MAG: hypothetical protein ACLQAS_08720 [Thermoplasmata archaeon]